MSYDPEMFSHYYWYDTAKRLKFSAAVLYAKLSELFDPENEIIDIQEFRSNQLAIFQSHMMLLGFALENLVKAVSIKKYTEQGNMILSFEDLQKKVWKVNNAHDIAAIAKSCNFNLTADESNLLDRHTEFVMWAGRYHIPKIRSAYDDAFENGKLRRRLGDHITADGIFGKAKTLLEANGG